MVLTEKGF